MSKNFGMISRTFVLADGEVRPFPSFDWVYLISATAAIEVSDDGNSFSSLPIRFGLKSRVGTEAGQIYLRNSSGAPNTITFATGYGDIIDGRLPDGASIEISNDVGNPLPVTSTQLPAALDADLGMKVHVQNTVNVRAAAPTTPLKGEALNMVDVAAHAIIAAQGAGLKIAVSALVFANASAVATVTTVLSAATELLRVYLPANSSLAVPLPTPLIGAANEALNAQNATNASDVTVTAVGFQTA